jgi:alpha-beta hydrolase superfamily lysophospholipase
LWNRRFALAIVLSIAVSAADPAASGRKALDLLLARNFAAFTQLLAPAAKQTMTASFLEQRTGPELDGFGALQQVGAPLIADNLVSFPVRFEKVSVNIQFTLTPSGQVAGLFFRPAESPLPPQWKHPAYSIPANFRESEVTIGTGEWKLPGTLTTPVTKSNTAVLLVHGPGPNDRDETLYSNRIFKDLAEGLASRGIIVLRYDKRTKVYGERMSGTSYTLEQETVEDAVAALKLLHQQAPKVFLLAHSLGGYAMPRIAQRDGNLAGAILLAANARPIEDVVLDQFEAAYKQRANDPAARLRLDQLKAEVAKVKTGNNTAALGLPAAYWADLKTYRPAQEAKRLAFPLLFLQGEQDTQVTMRDFETWRTALGAQKNAQFQSYPDLNHLFQSDDLRIPGNVSPVVLGRIANWIASQ